MPPLPPPPKALGSQLDASARAKRAAPSPVVPPPEAKVAKQSPQPSRTKAVAPAARNPSPRKTPAATPQQPAARPVQQEAAKRLEPQARSKPARRAAKEPQKLFVLDTNVLLHDPMSIYRFEEHDIYLPLVTLEELDAHKRGLSEVARNGRQVSRELDALVADVGDEIAGGIALNRTGHGEAKGRLFFQTQAHSTELPIALPQGKADNQILGVLQDLTSLHAGRPVVLVSKDINMRIKARALGLHAEDYANDKTLDDADLLYTGMLVLPPDFWERQAKSVESWQQGGHTFYRVQGKLVAQMLVNQAVFWESGAATPMAARVKEIRGNTAVLQVMRDHSHQKNAVWGVTARNREQNFALSLLMDPEVDFITLTGQAGTGKTLLALAAGLSQVLDARRYNEIIVTRVTVPVGEDIGYLPGTEEEKMSPWMGALDDNLEVLNQSESGGTPGGEWGRAATQELIRSKIKIKSLNFMRGRTFLNKYVVIDEAQNLTPKQMKTLITRAGPGTKIVCMGNIAQIDTPYLTEGSSGLTYVVDRFKGWSHSGHVTLSRGERSRLADYATDVL